MSSMNRMPLWHNQTLYTQQYKMTKSSACVTAKEKYFKLKTRLFVQNFDRGKAA